MPGELRTCFAPVKAPPLSPSNTSVQSEDDITDPAPADQPITAPNNNNNLVIIAKDDIIVTPAPPTPEPGPLGDTTMMTEFINSNKELNGTSNGTEGGSSSSSQSSLDVKVQPPSRSLFGGTGFSSTGTSASTSPSSLSSASSSNLSQEVAVTSGSNISISAPVFTPRIKTGTTPGVPVGAGKPAGPRQPFRNKHNNLGDVHLTPNDISQLLTINTKDTQFPNGNGWVAPPYFPPLQLPPPQAGHGNMTHPMNHSNSTIFHNSKSTNRGASPNRRFTPSPNSRGDSPNGSTTGTHLHAPIPVSVGGTNAAPPGGPPGVQSGPIPSIGPGQHVVDLHVNPGETVSFQMGDQMQVIHGPATVRMVSNNSTPPIPLPVTVPPGHMVQQIVDENGTLRHVILSPQPPMPMAPPMGPHNFGPGPNAPSQSQTSPHFYPQYPPHPVSTGPGGFQPGNGPPQYHPPPPHLQSVGSTATTVIGSHGSCPAHFAPQQSQCTTTLTAGGSGQPIPSLLHAVSQGPSPPPMVPLLPTGGGNIGNSINNNMAHKDERTQRQITKMKKKIEQRQQRELLTNAIFLNRMGPGAVPVVTFPPGLHANHIGNASAHLSAQAVGGLGSPRKENGVRKYKDRNTSTSGLDTPNDEEDEAERLLLEELLSKIKPPVLNLVTARSALVSWQPPDLDSDEETRAKYKDFEIQESEFYYEIHATDRNCTFVSSKNKFKLFYSGSDTEYKLLDLRPAADYSICLYALLDDLRGSASQVLSFTTLCCEPDTPQPPKMASRTKTSLSLKWNPTAENGGRITAYILEYDEGNPDNNQFSEVFNGAQKQFKVLKLTTATVYRFRLAATNEHGQSDWSEIVCYSTSGSAPNQPEPPILQDAQVSRLHLAWQKRLTDEEFTLQMEDKETGHGFLPVYNGRDAKYVCCGLRRNYEYKFRLCASNEEGTSRWSEVANFCTSADRPGIPNAPVVKGKVHPNCFKITWDHPKDNGGAEITKYAVEIDSGEGFELVNGSVGGTEFSCDHLYPGATYAVRVAAISNGGQSEFSESVCVTTLAVCPGQCPTPRLHGKPKAISIHIKWACPEIDGGSAITEYEVDMTSPDNSTRQAYRGRDTDCAVAGLLPGRLYSLQVRACNKMGHGPWSEPLEVMSGAGAPDRPKEPLIDCDSPFTANISWEEPFNNGAPITDFRLEWSLRDSNAYEILYQGPSLSYEVCGLEPATSYKFILVAINSAGHSPPSEAAVCSTQPSVPLAVLATTVRYSVTTTTVHLSWKEPNKHGAEIVGYNICLGDKHPLIGTQSAHTEYTVEHLMPETAYRVRIQAVNSMGVGAFSNPVKVTTRPLPPDPPRLECVGITHSSLKLRWGEGKNVDFRQFTLEMENPRVDSFVPVYQGQNFSHKINKLNEMTEYRFRIFATNQAGEGPFSEVLTFRTTRAAPQAPKTTKVVAVTDTTCQLEWQPVRALSDDSSIQYQLQLMGSSDSAFKTVYSGRDSSYRLTGLDPQTSYTMRVNCVRQFTDGSAALPGAYSNNIAFHTLQRESAIHLLAQSSGLTGVWARVVQRTKSGQTRQLSDQQWAAIILLGFSLLAIVAAMIMHWLMSGVSSGTAA